MRRPMLIVLFIAVVVAGVMAPGIVSAETKNSVNLGVGGLIAPDLTASAFFVEYERMIGSRIAVLGRGGGVNYTFDNDTYREEGKPKGVDIGVRAYPGGDGAMKGLFVGGAIGWWKTDWTFIDDQGKSYESHGKGDSSAIRADLEIGGRFMLGNSPVSLMPAFHLGHFFSSSNSCSYTAPASRVGTTCDKTSEVGFYSFLVVTVGIGF